MGLHSSYAWPGTCRTSYIASRNDDLTPGVGQARIWVVGLGTVGRWLLENIHSERERLLLRHGVQLEVVAVANARDGFVHDPAGLHLDSLMALLSAGRSIADQPGVEHWPTALEGLGATEADILVEVTGSPDDGEPGAAHMRLALERGIPVVTSNKWPVALHGVDLVRRAAHRGVRFRAEATVMSATPVIGPLVDGIAGARPRALRGILNATSNYILTQMMDGHSYADALRRAEAAGLAERGVDADVKGHDAVAKMMILAALVFGLPLRRDEVLCRPITDITPEQIDEALATGHRIRSVATLEVAEETPTARVEARVQPLALAEDDPLAGISGTTNAIICRSEPIGELMITGPGAGLAFAGQGVLSDLIAVAREVAA